MCIRDRHYILGLKNGDYDVDKVYFDTPYGRRRLDAYYSPCQIGLESKLGYACLSKRIRSEIDKDEYLLKQGILKRCIWVLYSSGSGPLVKRLEKANIEVSIGWAGHEVERIENLGYIPIEYFVMT